MDAGVRGGPFAARLRHAESADRLVTVPRNDDETGLDCGRRFRLSIGRNQLPMLEGSF
jgi:hypothetical protein